MCKSNQRVGRNREVEIDTKLESGTRPKRTF